MQQQPSASDMAPAAAPAAAGVQPVVDTKTSAVLAAVADAAQASWTPVQGMC